MRIRIRGLREAARKIEALAREGGEMNVKGMRVVGEEIMTDVKASRPGAGVPRDTGVLAGTGHVEGPDIRGLVTLSFGGAAAPYALRQHEELQYQHKLGEARYLIRGLERYVAGGKPLEALREQATAAIRAARRA